MSRENAANLKDGRREHDRILSRQIPSQQKQAGTFIPGLLIGWLLMMVLAKQPQEVLPPGWAGAGGHLASWALAADPSRWNARELRILPGIGEGRALRAVRARNQWQDSSKRAEQLTWEAVPGIGERTGALVRDDLAKRGIRQVELWPGH